MFSNTDSKRDVFSTTSLAKTMPFRGTSFWTDFTMDTVRHHDSRKSPDTNASAFEVISMSRNRVYRVTSRSRKVMEAGETPV